MEPETEWCYHHHDYEDASGEIYRVCGECLHVYRTAADLVSAYNHEAADMAAHWADLLDGGSAPPVLRDLTEDDADHIGFCQFCLHDW